ncbi:hypothetical protein TRICI_005008 [Trichomonascus ciferrii]|uniref:K Homology domain-containing protein n=1 Tax=Trichomonascus ciferrii TaxID=44093 RepID=A0A642UXM9_9ASCO|nr:hypothetical protein TRICI_005008 [Trichomonascus ciferrii]
MASNGSGRFATLCVPLKYSSAARPVTDESHTVYFDTTGSDSIWRKYEISPNFTQYDARLEGCEVMDCLPVMREAVTSTTKNEEIPVKGWLNEDRLLEGALTLSLKGDPNSVNQERSRILRNFYEIQIGSVGIDRGILFDENNELSSKLTTELENVAKYCKVAISVADYVEPKAKIVNDSSKPYHVLIFGDQDAVKFAVMKVNILVEDLVGNFVDSLPLDLSLQPLVCGPMLANLKNIQTQTGVRVYSVDWIPEVLGSQSTVDVRNLNEIYIAGNVEASVMVAKTMLKEIIKKTKPVFKDCVVSFGKTDLLILRYQQEMLAIMKSYGSFIQLPYLGAARSLIRVQGCTSQSVEKTISKLMALITEIYNANYWIHTGDQSNTADDGTSTLTQPTIETDLEFLDKITFASGATILCLDNNSFDITGYSSDTKRATGMIKALPIWKDYYHQIRFRVELSIDQRDFIAGKKNGKVIRIMNNSNVWIKFLPFNEYNFYITLSADDYNSVTAGIRLLEDELPSEQSFYIPETYHKQVIGAGGLTIQTIMRKYNVFIKFSNDYDTHPNGFSHVRPDNVLIRCPSKNAKNIPAARQELIDTVQERGRDHCNTFIHIPRSHRRVLLSEQCGFIHEVESKTNTIILFPEDEPENIQENDLIEIRGLGNTSEDASRMVKALLPEDYVFKVAYSAKFDEIVNEKNPEFYTKIIAPFRIALSIETQVFPQPIMAEEEMTTSTIPNGSNSPPTRYHRIVLSFSQEHSVGLEDVIQALTAFLRDKGLDIVDRGELKFDPVEPGTASIQASAKRTKQQSNVYNKPAFDEQLAPPLPPPRYPSPPLPPPSEEDEYRHRYSRFYRPHHHHSASSPSLPPPPRSPRSPSRTRYSSRPATSADYYRGRRIEYDRYDWREDDRYRRYDYNEYRERYY